MDTGAFDEQRYFDVTVEYAKSSPEDILIRITVENPSAWEARLHVLPTLWFRNTWSWGRSGEGYGERPHLQAIAERARPCHGNDVRYREDPRFRDLVLFHEYFHGEDGRGIGASQERALRGET